MALPTTAKPSPHVDTQRQATTKWIAIAEMNVTPAAQRKYVPAHAESMAADFDLEALGYPVVNFRDGRWWIVDGQHRIGALKLIGWGDQMVECEAYVGLTEAQEADLFLRRDKRKAITPIDKFRIAVNAGRETETAIHELVTSLGLKTGYGPNRIGAVNTLIRVYRDGGPDVLGRALLIIREAYGETGFGASIIAGMGLVIRRYGTLVDTERAVTALQRAAGGVGGVDQKANGLVKSTGNSKEACVAASVVEIINRSRGKKLPNWWRED